MAGASGLAPTGAAARIPTSVPTVGACAAGTPDEGETAVARCAADVSGAEPLVSPAVAATGTPATIEPAEPAVPNAPCPTAACRGAAFVASAAAGCLALSFMSCTNC